MMIRSWNINPSAEYSSKNENNTKSAPKQAFRVKNDQSAPSFDNKEKISIGNVKLH